MQLVQIERDLSHELVPRKRQHLRQIGRAAFYLQEEGEGEYGEGIGLEEVEDEGCDDSAAFPFFDEEGACGCFCGLPEDS